MQEAEATGVAEEIVALLEPFGGAMPGGVGGVGGGADGIEIRAIAPDAVRANRVQPRRAFPEDQHEALCRSIARHGVLQPLLVREPGEDGGYELIAGERRLRAARSIGLDRVPAVICRIPEERLLEVALVENLQRASLNPIEEAEAYRSLIDRYGYTQETVAERVGKSRSTIANAMRLLDLPDGVRREVEGGKLTAGHARALAGLTSAEQQLQLSEVILKRGLSVRDTEEEVKRLKNGRRDARRPDHPPYLERIEDRLRHVLGTRVRLVQTSRQKGRIVIDFHSDAEFERLLEFFS